MVIKRGLFIAVFILFIACLFYAPPIQSQSSLCTLDGAEGVVLSREIPKIVNATYAFGEVKISVVPNGISIYQEPIDARTGNHLPVINYRGVFNDQYSSVNCKYYQFQNNGSYYGLTYEVDSCGNVLVTTDSNGEGFTYSNITKPDGRAANFYSACSQREAFQHNESIQNTTQNTLNNSNTIISNITQPLLNDSCSEILANSHDCSTFSTEFDCTSFEVKNCCKWNGQLKVLETRPVPSPESSPGCDHKTSPPTQQVIRKIVPVCYPSNATSIPEVTLGALEGSSGNQNDLPLQCTVRKSFFGGEVMKQWQGDQVYYEGPPNYCKHSTNGPSTGTGPDLFAVHGVCGDDGQIHTTITGCGNGNVCYKGSCTSCNTMFIDIPRGCSEIVRQYRAGKL